MDSTVFSEAIVDTLQDKGIEFSISVPLARYTELKAIVEHRQRWKPKSWGKRYRFDFVRELTKVQSKELAQLELFTPYDCRHEFKVILTNKRINMKKLAQYHNGRGYQENVFAELKPQIYEV